MGRNRLSDQEIAQFRESLLNAAMRLFAERGYQAVSIRALAAETGCSPMTPYRYFENKAAIFDACRSLAFERFAEEQEAVAVRHSDPISRINELGRAYAGHARAHPDAFKLMFELDQPAEASPDLRRAERRAFNTLRLAVADAVNAGLLDGDPLTLAHLYWATVHGVVVLDITKKLVHGRSQRALLSALLGGRFSHTPA